MAAVKEQRQQPSSYRLRIVDYREVPASQLVVNRRNPRRHPEAQKSALQRSLETIGIAGAELVRQLPDGRLELIDGELRHDLIGDQRVPCLITDLTEDEADRVLAEYDAITLLATYDAERSDALAARIRAAGEVDAARLLRITAEADPSRDLLARLRLEAERDEQRARDALDNAAEDDADDDGSDAGEDEDDDLLFDDDDAGESGKPTRNGTFGVFSREAVLDAAVAHYRQSGFPYRRLAPFVSMQRINKLAATPLDKLVRSNVGGDVADTYHPHRFHGHVDTWLSPYEAFGDDALLRHALELRLDDAGTLHDGYPTTLNLVNHTRACFNFRPGFACYLYRTYCQPGDVVLDTSTGYGGRLVGWMASGIAVNGGRYIGIDPSTQTHAGNVRMAEELGFAERVELYNVPAEDLDPAVVANRCDFAFTSPPYFAKERYCDEETQSYRRYPSAEAWRDGFLAPTLRLQFAALRAGAYSLVNVADVTLVGKGNETYPLVEWTREAAEAAGFTYVETLYFPLASSFGLGWDAAATESEPVLVFRKPQDAPSYAVSIQKAAADMASPPSTQPRTAPKPLAQWMAQLYRVSADETCLCGDLGMWPIELGDYLKRLCLAYSPRPARYTLASGLLTPNSCEKPYQPDTCVLLYSGGKDSMAAGVLAERAGYHVHAVYVRRVNHSYPHEGELAERSARLLGWDWTAIKPLRVATTRGESVVKNQYCLALALDVLPFVPRAITTGSYRYEDCHTTSWFSDTRSAYDAFIEALNVATDGRTRYVQLLGDERQALSVWHKDIAEDVQVLTASCMMPPRNKPQHRARNLAAGVPLLPYDCGACEKCLSRALILSDLADLGAMDYPAPYLAHAAKRLSQTFAEPLWIHAHPLLEAPHLPHGASLSHVLDDVFGGRLSIAEPRINREPAIAPDVTTLDC